MTPFLKLDDFLSPPPLSAITAALMTLGLKYLGGRLVQAFPPESRTTVFSAASFVVVTSLVAAAAHFLAFLQIAYTWPLRVMAWSLAALGILELSRWPRERLGHLGRQAHLIFTEQPLWGRAALVLLGITVAGLGLAVLGPPTDLDSLNYHLGVPLEILRRHGAHPRPDWVMARTAGLGESLNMLGLAGGTDNFGACLQFAGLVAVLTAIISLAKENSERLLLAIFVLSCPVVAPLVLSQKPLLLPLAATTIALIMIAGRFAAMDPLTLVLAYGCAFFAMACKYSFLLTGPVVVGAGLVAAYRAGRLGLAVGVALAAYLILVFPVHWQNYLFYGDPLSPFLERFRAHGDVAAMTFAANLRLHTDFEGSLWLLPVKLTIPDSLGAITVTLGLGLPFILGVWGQFRKPGAPRVLLISAFLAAAGVLTLGQIAGRFFLEPYLWMVAAAAAAAWRPRPKLFFRLMVCQLSVMALIAGFCAAAFFPGSLTGYLRNQTMIRWAYGYSEARWLDEVLPPEAVVLTEVQFPALLSRPFLVTHYLYPENLENPRERQKARDLCALSGVNTLVAYYPVDQYLVETLGSAIKEPLAGPQEFWPATYRNPWKRKVHSQLVVKRLHFD